MFYVWFPSQCPTMSLLNVKVSNRGVMRHLAHKTKRDCEFKKKCITDYDWIFLSEKK